MASSWAATRPAGASKTGAVVLPAEPRHAGGPPGLGPDVASLDCAHRERDRLADDRDGALLRCLRSPGSIVLRRVTVGAGGEHGGECDSTTAVVGEAVPLAVRAVEGRDVRAEAGWTACMPGLSWKYDGAGVFDAPAGRVAAQLDAIRVALVDAGFRDVTEVEDQVAVERDDVTIAFSPQRATGDPEAWQVSFHTSCLKLSGDDKERAETGTRSPVAGLE